MQECDRSIKRNLPGETEVLLWVSVTIVRPEQVTSSSKDILCKDQRTSTTRTKAGDSLVHHQSVLHFPILQPTSLSLSESSWVHIYLHESIFFLDASKSEESRHELVPNCKNQPGLRPRQPGNIGGQQKQVRLFLRSCRIP
jgi:hypothetical protein